MKSFYRSMKPGSISRKSAETESCEAVLLYCEASQYKDILGGNMYKNCTRAGRRVTRQGAPITIVIPHQSANSIVPSAAALLLCIRRAPSSAASPTNHVANSFEASLCLKLLRRPAYWRVQAPRARPMHDRKVNKKCPYLPLNSTFAAAERGVLHASRRSPPRCF